MKKLMIAFAAVAAFGAAFAAEESVEDAAPEAAISEEIKDASSLLTEYLDSKGWTEGANQNKGGVFMVQTGIGAIQAPPGHPSYNDARVRAFDKAMLDAKAKLAKSLEEEISVAVETAYVEPPKEMKGPEQQLAKAMAEMPDDSIFGKAKTLIGKKLDNALRAEGYDPDAAKAAGQSKVDELRAKLESVSSKDSFKKSVRAGATSAISGAQAFYTIEVVKGKRAEIGVVLIWSPKLGEMASSLVTGKPVAGVKPKTPIRSQLTNDSKVLLSTFGIQQKIDENGNYVLVSFGQSGARNDSSRSAQAAYDKAALQARSQIRQFAGETVSVSEAQDQAEETLEYDNGALPDYTDSSSYEQYQKSVAAKMKINGIMTIKKWNSVHPVSGKPVYGVIMSWSPKAAEFAREMKKTIEATAKDGAAGRRTVPAVQAATQRQSTQSVAKPTATENVKGGAAGDDDAF